MNTSTVPASAQAILPVTRWPPLTTTNAAAVAVRCIGCVNRTERIAVRSTFAVPLTGRNRTTDGALPVDTTIAGTASNGRPSASTSPSSQMRYFAPGLSVLHGVKTYSPDAAPACRSPWSAGVERSAARTAASGTARSSLIVNDVSARTRSPSVRVAATDPVPAAAVSTTLRIGAPSLPPASERALPSIVTV